jgi:hypothetical protein
VKQGKQKLKKPKFYLLALRFGLFYPQYLATAGVGAIGIVVDFDTSKFTICTDRFYILKIK